MRRQAVLALLALSVLAGPTAGDIGSCRQEAAELDSVKFFAEKKSIDCGQCIDCGLTTALCRQACTEPFDPATALFPEDCVPLVHDGVMFMPNPSDVVHAIDAGTGDLLWEYRRPLPADIGKAVPFPAINRNVAIYGSMIIDTSADDFVYALDAASGKLVWETRILDYQKNPAQQTSGPIIARGRVVSGRGCEPKGGPEACVITAHDARTARQPPPARRNLETSRSIHHEASIERLNYQAPQSR